MPRSPARHPQSRYGFFVFWDCLSAMRVRFLKHSTIAERYGADKSFAFV